MRASPRAGSMHRKSPKLKLLVMKGASRVSHPSSQTAHDDKSQRERRCIASGESANEADLIRFACGPGGVVTPDVAAKLPGRGAWVRADRASVARAVKQGAFARAL